MFIAGRIDIRQNTFNLTDMDDDVQVTAGPIAASSRTRSKHMWTDEQDKILVEAMVELFHAGTHRAESGFKSGFLNVLVEKLNAKFPSITITNIKSRLKTLRKDLSLYNDIQGISGFGWDPRKNMVTADAKVWDVLLQADNKWEKCMKFPFPYFDDLHMIFGMTRANGVGAEDAGDAEDNIRVEDPLNDSGITMDDVSVEDDTSKSSPTERMSKKKKVANAEMLKGLAEAVKKLGDDIKTSSSDLGDKIAGPHSDMRSRLNGELEKIDVLPMLQRFTLVAHIASDTSLLEVFFSLPELQREAFALEIAKKLNV